MTGGIGLYPKHPLKWNFNMNFLIEPSVGSERPTLDPDNYSIHAFSFVNALQLCNLTNPTLNLGLMDHAQMWYKQYSNEAAFHYSFHGFTAVCHFHTIIIQIVKNKCICSEKKSPIIHTSCFLSREQPGHHTLQRLCLYQDQITTHKQLADMWHGVRDGSPSIANTVELPHYPH